MRDFALGILTPTGEGFSGRVQELFLRTTSGEVGIMANHTDYLAGVEPCVTKLTDAEGHTLIAFCGGGFLSVVKGEASLVVDEFAFSDALSAESVKAERDAIAAEFAACDAKKQPEKAEYLKTALARAETKVKAVER